MSEEPFVLDPSIIASIDKRVKAGLFDYVVPLLIIISGVIMFSTAMDTFSAVAGYFIEALGIVMVIINQLGGKQIYTGITSGKRFAKIRIVELVDRDKMLVRPIPKGEHGKTIARIIIAIFGTGFFLIYAIISLLMINTSKLKRSLADQLTGTVVINFDSQISPAAGSPTVVGSSSTTDRYLPVTQGISQGVSSIPSGSLKISNIPLGRSLVTAGLIGLIFYRIYNSLRIIYIAAYDALSAFANYYLPGMNLLQTFRTLFIGISIISFLSILIGLFISMSSMDSKLKSPFLIALIIFGVLFILAVIQFFVQPGGGFLTLSYLYGYYQTYMLVETIFNLVFETIIIIIILITLGSLSGIFRKAASIYNTKPQHFPGSFIFLFFYIVLKIAAVISCSVFIHPWHYGDIVAGIVYFAFRVLFLVFNLILIGVYGAMNRKFRRFSHDAQHSASSM